LLHVERDRADLFERGFPIAAGAERAITSHEQQPAAEIADVRGQGRDLRRCQIDRADVGQNDQIVEREGRSVAWHLRGVAGAHVERRALERVHERSRQRLVALQHERAGFAGDAHERRATVVLGRLVAPRVLGRELDVVAV
jgi:hypothetical protein